VSIHPDLLTILACPKCKGALTVVDAEAGLYCPPCAIVFPVRDDIPIMLVEEAVSKADWDAGKRSAKDEAGK
jgi:uncharacterized protein YbaR (Trm112 family)